MPMKQEKQTISNQENNMIQKPNWKEWRGTGGREPGRIGAGGVQEAGGERTGSGIPKVA